MQAPTYVEQNFIQYSVRITYNKCNVMLTFEKENFLTKRELQFL